MARARHTKKRIVILCDGTWNEPDAPCPTNIVKLARCIAPLDSEGVVQTIFYDQGVGTEGRFDKYLGGAFGKGVSKNVLDGYRYLVHNYQEGDDIFLFGFSRGGYTARAIAGMVACIGLLQKHELGQLSKAYSYYRLAPDKRGTPTFNVGARPDICMIGVFDTVGALGAPTHLGQSLSRNWVGFFDTTLSAKVKSAFQALAVDEHRTLFRPDIWVGQPVAGQTVEQCWFRGAHSDIGGGYPSATLADIALNWLAKAAAVQGLALARLPDTPAAAVVKPHDSMTGFYKALGLMGKGKLNRLTDLSFSASAKPMNMTVHPTAAPCFSSHPEYAELWRTDRVREDNQRLSLRIPISQLDKRYIHLVQNNQRINAEIVDINDMRGMKVKCNNGTQLASGVVDVFIPGSQPLHLQQVWSQGELAGLH